MVILPQSLMQVLYSEKSDSWTEILEFLKKLNPSDIDYMAYVTFLVLLQVSYYIFSLNNWRMRTGLVTMQNSFSDYCQNYIFPDDLMDKYGNYLRLNSIILGILLLLASIGTGVGMALFFAESDVYTNIWHFSKISYI